MVVYPLMEQPCVKAGLLLKLREKRPATVVGRGPKGWVCTGTHTGHTGRDRGWVLENVRIHTYTKLVHSLFARSIGPYRWAAREHFTAYFDRRLLKAWSNMG